MTEEQLQAACTQWFWNTYPAERRMLHHNNNNSSNRISGARKKALGVVDGVPDLELVLPGCVWFMELKTSSGSQSPAQKDFQAKVEARGHVYLIIRDLETFKTYICQVIGK